MTLKIGDTTRDGLFQIVDTNWNHDGGLRVTVREMIGGGGLDMPDAEMVKRMRALARRAADHPEKTRSARVVNRFIGGGCIHITFNVSQLEDQMRVEYREDGEEVLVAKIHANGVREVINAEIHQREYPDADVVTCGVCGRSWDNSVSTGLTPIPSGRCPFEYEHVYPEVPKREFVNGKVELGRTVKVYYVATVTRDQAIEYLLDAGASDEEIAGMSDAEIIDAMISPQSDYADQVGDQLDDLSSENDSGSQPWELVV